MKEKRYLCKNLFGHKKMKMQLFRWFLANALLPIFVPVLFLSGVEWFQNGTFPFDQIFGDLLGNGFYVFSALALIFSLLEDNPVLKMCMGYMGGAWLMLLTILSLYMFFLIQTEDSKYVENNWFQFGIVWVLSAVSALYYKKEMIDYKIRNAVK